MVIVRVLTTRKTEFVDITGQVREAIAPSAGAVVTVFVPHTTAGIVLQAAGEGATKVAADLETAFGVIVDESWDWQHTGEGDRNPWSHVRAAIAGSSVTSR